ncbi:STAS domain-containing protein [candidate division KSB1 bacterium]|nr:STAS domain-containing protein [candidate division KSB1 bacterium]NIR68958.1 STAS domain-containing protein [candidate division KSB1 bacterium]NIS27295.1 STAS domain-containing protein [candidate division KSB1 bacterium]NIT74174.1 STAS domain-containing protein [candidate division KSB1 bacterium]NIU28025.1 STAS domain-containing protein [candidate division KSB1 bacterium]
MQIKEQMHGDVAVIELKGKLMGGPETTAIHDKVKELVGNNTKKIVIDLGKVKWMNSSGLGALMGSMTTVKNAGGDLKLAKVTEKVKSLFMITKLVTIFETFDSVDEAVASFG